MALVTEIAPVPAPHGDRAAERAFRVAHPESGLLGFIVVDSTARGPAAGGTRTARYADEADALTEATALARAMSHKCALAGLDAGGAKAVLVEDAIVDRQSAFAAYGEAVASLEGSFRTAGDFGTTTLDLEHACVTGAPFVHGANPSAAADLATAVGSTVVACARAAGVTADSTVVVQGVGAMGSATAKEFAAMGCRLILSDVDNRVAATVAANLGATTCPPDAIFSVGADVFAPCAKGGVITVEIAAAMNVDIVCGAANCIAASQKAERIAATNAIVVPDVLASSGAVIFGIAQSVMHQDPAPLLARIGDTCAEILAEAKDRGAVPSEVAIGRAEMLLRQSPDGDRG